MKQRAVRTISYILMPTTFALVFPLLLTFLTRQDAGRITVAAGAILGIPLITVQFEALYKIAGAI